MMMSLSDILHQEKECCMSLQNRGVNSAIYCTKHKSSSLDRAATISDVYTDGRHVAEQSSGIFNRWNFPKRLGAIDGKHYLQWYMQQENVSSYIDVVSYGGNSDCGSEFGRQFRTESLPVSRDGILPETNKATSFVFTVDDALPLQHNTMKPFSRGNITYSKQIFNYRLSRDQGVVEMTFGNLEQMWRILLYQIEVQPDTATDIVKALADVHNFVKSQEPGRGFLNEEALQDKAAPHTTTTPPLALNH